MSRWTLAIDFGTTYTTAAARIGDRPEIIEIDGDRRVPSIVALDESGALIVGRAAENEAATSPAKAMREPKRRLGEPAPVILGGRPFPITTLVAAILAYVYEHAVEYVGSPPAELRLTHPATWRRPRVRALGAAAAAAGLPEPTFIPEPVAAAISYTVEGDHIDPNDFVAVYDLGGGTFDTAVLRRDEGGGFVVEGRPGGEGRMGGEYFDELLAEHLGRQLPEADWEALQASDEIEWRQAGAAFRTAVRRAKEALSLQAQTELLVPLPAGLRRLRVTRAEFEELIRPHLVEATELLATTIADASLEPHQLSTIYLVGGASRIPLVGDLLGAAFPGVAVSRRGDPKMVVALGATYPGDFGATSVSLTPTPLDALGAVGAGMTPPLDRTYVDPRTPVVPTPPPPPPARRSRRPLAAILAAAALVVVLVGVVLGANLLAPAASSSPGPSQSPGIAVASANPSLAAATSSGPPTGGTVAVKGNVGAELTSSLTVSVSIVAPSHASPITLFAVSNTNALSGGKVFAYSQPCSEVAWSLDKGTGKGVPRSVYAWFQDASGRWSSVPVEGRIVFDNPPVMRKGVVFNTGTKYCGHLAKYNWADVHLLPTVATDADGSGTIRVDRIWDSQDGEDYEYDVSADGRTFRVPGPKSQIGRCYANWLYHVRVVDDQGLTATGDFSIRFGSKSHPCPGR